MYGLILVLYIQTYKTSNKGLQLGTALHDGDKHVILFFLSIKIMFSNALRSCEMCICEIKHVNSIQFTKENLCLGNLKYAHSASL